MMDSTRPSHVCAACSGVRVKPLSIPRLLFANLVLAPLLLTGCAEEEEVVVAAIRQLGAEYYYELPEPIAAILNGPFPIK